MSGTFTGHTALVIGDGYLGQAVARALVEEGGHAATCATSGRADAVFADIDSIDLLIVASELGSLGSVVEMDDDRLDAALENGLRRPWRWARGFARSLDGRPSKSRRIVFVSSIAATRGSAEESGTGTILAGLHGLTRALARELGPAGMSVNCVAIGGGHASPLGRSATDEELAEAVVMLCRSRAAYINGQIIEVAGGP